MHKNLQKKIIKTEVKTNSNMTNKLNCIQSRNRLVKEYLCFTIKNGLNGLQLRHIISKKHEFFKKIYIYKHKFHHCHSVCEQTFPGI